MAIEHDVSLFEECPKLTKLLNTLVKIRQAKDAQRNQRILIFGTGEAGRRFYQKAHYQHHILAFVDNDHNKQGNMLNNLPILSPAEISTMTFDVIYIASQYYLDIYKQLVHELAVPASKIECWLNSL